MVPDYKLKYGICFNKTLEQAQIKKDCPERQQWSALSQTASHSVVGRRVFCKTLEQAQTKKEPFFNGSFLV
jgi:hypothetical protein